MKKESQPVVIWGASGHARVLQEFLPSIGYRLVAIFDNSPDAKSPFPDVPLYIGSDSFTKWRREYNGGDIFGLVAIGGDGGRHRRFILQLFSESGISIPAIVHPGAFIAASARLGAGSQILAGALIGADARIGSACIVNTGASVDHECVLLDGVHIAPGAVLAGCVNVAEDTLIGAGAVILPRISIGRNAIVGAGSVVTRDVADDSVVFGNPARSRRTNTSR